MKKIILFACISFLFSCSTLFTGTTEVLSFTSVPEKATIQFDGLTMGKTPLTMEVNKSFKGVVSVKKEGYETREFKLQRSFNEVSILNFLGILGWGVDYVTGAMWKFDRKGYEIELDSKE